MKIAKIPRIAMQIEPPEVTEKEKPVTLIVSISKHFPCLEIN
jgi:hypothetical protein